MIASGAIGDHCEILAFAKTTAAKFIEQCNRSRCLTWGRNHEGEAIDTARLLRARRKRPDGGGAAQKRDEVAAPHWHPRGSKRDHLID
jgi:hypothetical protein